MKIIGQWPIDKKGEGLIELKEQIEVIQSVDFLTDKDGTILAVRDCYGDWVSPGLYSRGIKSRMEVMV